MENVTAQQTTKCDCSEKRKSRAFHMCIWTYEMALTHDSNRAKVFKYKHLFEPFTVQEKAMLKYRDVFARVIWWRQLYVNMISLMQFSLMAATRKGAKSSLSYSFPFDR
jgi:hypothetical protein